MTSISTVGIGLRYPHYQKILMETPPISWLEVHTENFLLSGGPAIGLLTNIRKNYPLSFHGIGLSLGSAHGAELQHIKRIKKLIDQFEPFLISEHLSWSNFNGHFLPDLLPTPYTEETLRLFIANIDKVQNLLNRQILIENPSTYLEFNSSTYAEADFLVAIAKHTGAKILLDINNIYVSCCNHHLDPYDYLKKIPLNLVGEIHLAGHSIQKNENNQILRVDTHDNHICPEVFDLYFDYIQSIPDDTKEPLPVLIEWDANIPPLEILMEEAEKVLRCQPFKGEKYAIS